MKYILTILTSLFLATAYADDKKEPAKEENKAHTKEVCKDKKGKDGQPVIGKDGKPQQECKTIKVHKKYEGTEIPEGKKK